MSDIEDATSASTVSFQTALVFNAAVFGIQLVAFTILRPRFRSIYEPRTYVPDKTKRSEPMSRSLFAWPIAVWKMDYRDIIAANGMDAYFFVRFLRMAVKMFLPIWIVSWAVLLPVTSVGTGKPGNEGLNLFTFGNVADEHRVRYAAHLILVYFFTFWILYNIKTEMSHFAIERQKYLISPAHSKSSQANTVLITGIPTKYLSQKSLRKMFKDLPGGVKNIWINRDLGELPDIYQRRLDACNKLEAAETKLLSQATKLRASGATSEKKNVDVEAGDRDVRSAASVVPKEKRPTHKLGFLGLLGEKVDTIEWATKEIQECNQLLDQGRETIQQQSGSLEDGFDEGHYGQFDEAGERAQMAQQIAQAEAALNKAKSKVTGIIPGMKQGGAETYPPLNSAFVLFNRQIAAHLAAQALNHHEPYRMSERYTEMSPEDVIWSNLGMNPYERKIRVVISWALTIGLIVVWTFPVAFVGALSNVPKLSATYSWLGWLGGLPPVVTGIISGILPPVLLAVLMMLLPIVLRMFARFEGIPKYTGLELSLMTRYFLFQVIHSFLIVSLSSGIISALPELLGNPGSIPNLLAKNLPQASIFFLTYIILQGLSGSSGGFLQIVPLAIYYVKLILLGSSPRSVHGIKFTLRSVSWGTQFPVTTLLVVITLGYSIIAPIINGLATATFFMFYMMYKYLFLYAYGQRQTAETGGLFFPKAIQHVFVGMYVQQVCLAALFFLGGAVPQGALTIVLIVCTAGFNIVINNSYGPLLHALPLSLAEKTWGSGTPDSGWTGNSMEMARQPTTTTRDGDYRESADEQRGILPNKHQQDQQHFASPKDSRHATSAAAGGSDRQRPPLDRDGSDAQFEDYGFSHPATSRPQRIVWLPQDPNGFVDEEQRAAESAGVKTSTRHSTMNEKGKVDVDGPPPDDVSENI